MLKKNGSYFADWRDERGTRKRRAFDTRRGALKFQARMERETAAKKAHGSGPRVQYSKPTRKQSRTARSSTASKPRASSPPKLAKSPSTT